MQIVDLERVLRRAIWGKDRTWRQGFHQAVEAMEDLELTNPSETLARISFQQFFRLFKNEQL